MTSVSKRERESEYEQYIVDHESSQQQVKVLKPVEISTSSESFQEIHRHTCHHRTFLHNLHSLHSRRQGTSYQDRQLQASLLGVFRRHAFCDQRNLGNRNRIHPKMDIQNLRKRPETEFDVCPYFHSILQ